MSALSGDSNDANPAVSATNTATGAGVLATANGGDAVHGETNSNQHAGVAGFNKTGILEGNFNPAGVFGTSEVGEGVHGQTNSTEHAGVGGVNLNAGSTGPGVHAESRGHGPGLYAKGATAGYFEGSVVVTGDIMLPGADYAEDFDVVGNPEPGTVVVIEDSGSVRPSNKPYDSRVAGVVAGAGNRRSALILDRQPGAAPRSPLALMGKVYCKADAKYAPILVGDLLTTSATPGHAMKAIDRQLAFGAILGKALSSLDSGCGLVPILVTLQ